MLGNETSGLVEAGTHDSSHNHKADAHLDTSLDEQNIPTKPAGNQNSFTKIILAYIQTKGSCIEGVMMVDIKQLCCVVDRIYMLSCEWLLLDCWSASSELDYS